MRVTMGGIRELGPKVRSRCNATTVRGVVDDKNADALALGMRDLYLECVSNILNDNDVRFHVLMMPSMTGKHYTYSMRDEEEMCQHVADLLNVNIHENDCAVVLGKEILGRELTEDEMLALAISDVSLHLSRISNVGGSAACWQSQNIGWSAIASVIAAAHPMINGLGAAEAMNEQIKHAAKAAIMIDHRSVAEGPVGSNMAALEAIERICDKALDERGGYISLPASAKQIEDVATEFYFEAVSNMDFLPGESTSAS